MQENKRAPALASSEDVQTLENVLTDTPTSPRSRAWLLKRAALGAGVIAAATPLGRALASGGGDTPQTVGTTAVTAEALAVTYLTAVIGKLGSGLGPAELPLKAANAAEEDHYTFLSKAGFKPETTKFWIPDSAFQAANAAEEDHFTFLSKAGFKPETTKFWIPDSAFQAANVAPTVEVLETIFVNAYLIGTTVFANAKSSDLARYTGEIAGVEAEHRTLARQLQGKLPDNLGFESYKVQTMSAIVGELQAIGIGLGQQGSQPGAYYTYSGTTSATTVSLDNNAPDQAVPFPTPMLAGVKAARATKRKKMPSGTPVVTG